MGSGRREVLPGGAAFVKRWPSAPEGFFSAEAAGLAWLAEARAIRVVPVIAADATSIAVAWIDEGRPGTHGLEELGRGLAAMHSAGAPSFGSSRPGFIGPLPMANTPADSWAAFYAECRVLPFLATARDRGAIDPRDAAAVERVVKRIDELAGPPEPPARIHGDLWWGNVLWDRDGVPWLVDPAAHGGHRETDLAMLALFSERDMPRVAAAYGEIAPLAEGWRDRVVLHQLHPLLVHAALFGGGYGAQAGAAARRALGATG